MAKRGRKSTYNQKLVDSILKQFRSGDDLIQCCKDHKLSVDTFYDWADKNYGNCGDDYEKAKKAHVESLSHKLDEFILAPTSEKEEKFPHVLKLRELFIKKKKFDLERRFKTYYGNSVNVEVKHEIGVSTGLERLKKKLAEYKDLQIKAIKQSETGLECPKVIEHDTLVVKHNK